MRWLTWLTSVGRNPSEPTTGLRYSTPGTKFAMHAAILSIPPTTKTMQTKWESTVPSHCVCCKVELAGKRQGVKYGEKIFRSSRRRAPVALGSATNPRSWFATLPWTSTSHLHVPSRASSPPWCSLASVASKAVSCACGASLTLRRE